jgi:hypothetical protein
VGAKERRGYFAAANKEAPATTCPPLVGACCTLLALYASREKASYGTYKCFSLYGKPDPTLLMFLDCFMQGDENSHLFETCAARNAAH